MKKGMSSIFVLLFLLLLLPFSSFLVKNFQRYLSRASFSPANIIVDVSKIGGPLSSSWKALAQGGEIEKDGIPVSFSDTVPYLTSLSPRYIRIDHIYDFYNVVSKNTDGSLSFDWSRLDKVVDDILKCGATPFFSLSYMPPAIAQEGNIIGLPNSWNDWQNVVKTTIEHYSGQKQKNLNNVYYEVWNEPDLFGSWRIGGEKNYLLLYKYAALGASSAKDVNIFKIGGPATTTPMRVWIDNFLTFVRENNLRIDFVSWHRYSLDPFQFNRDLISVNNWLSKHPNYQNIEKIISEWGSDSENNKIHDTNFDAIHTLATVKQIEEKVNLAFSFEIKDGPGPENKKYWGRWGIFTHNDQGLSPKPRYHALLFLENLRGNRISLSGEGSDVTGLAVKDDKDIKILLVNYKNSSGADQEAVPLKIVNFPKGIYEYSEVFFLGKRSKKTIRIDKEVFEKTFYLPVNQAVIIHFSKISELANFESGRLIYPENKALIFDKDVQFLTYSIDEVLPEGTVELWLKNNFTGASIKEQLFLEIPLQEGLKLVAKKEIAGFGSVIKYGLFNNEGPLQITTLDITRWQPGEWHFLSFSWQKETPGNLNLGLVIDGKTNQAFFSNFPNEMTISKVIIGGYDGSIDELRISRIKRDTSSDNLIKLEEDKNTIILKSFDGKL